MQVTQNQQIVSLSPPSLRLCYLPNNDKKHEYMELHTPSLRQPRLPSLILSIYILWPTQHFCDTWDTLCPLSPL